MMAPEAPRRLTLTRISNRDHLSCHPAEVERIALRYLASAATPIPVQSLFHMCEATLVEQIVTMRSVPADQGLRARHSVSHS